jgi:multiple sugar transport system substrate-binding protein
MMRPTHHWRTAAALGTAAVVALTGTACTAAAGGDGDSVVWSTWGTPEELTRFQEFNQQFMEDHSDLTVELQPVASYDEYHSRLLAQLTSGTAPDVFYIGDDRIGEFVEAGVLMPLADRMAGEGSVTPEEDFFPGLFGAAAVDGEIYAAPNDSNPDALWFDLRALEAAGITENPADLAERGEWTTEKFLEMTGKLADAGLIGSMFWNYWATHWSWVSSQGGQVFDESGAFVAADDPTTVDAVTELGARFQSGEFVVADTMPEGAGADSAFVTHGAGFFAQGRYTIGTVQSSDDPTAYDIVRWPTPDGQPAPTGVATSFLAINANTDAPDAAFQFWTEFLSAEGQQFRLGGGGNAVPSIAGADDVVLEGDYPAHAQTFLDMRDTGFEEHPQIAGTAGLSSDISAAFLELYEGSATAEDTLAKIGGLIEESQG